MTSLQERLGISNNQPSRVKSNLLANFIGQVWVALMSLAFIPLYIKYLGVEAYGLIGLFALMQTLSRVLDMGMTPTLGREMARFSGGGSSTESIVDLLRSIEILVAVIALLIILGVGLGSSSIASSWLQSEILSSQVVARAIVIMGLVLALRFVESVYRSAIVGLQRQVLFNWVNGSMATLRGLGAVAILVWVSPTIEAFFLWQGAVSILTVFVLACSTYSILPQGFRNGRFSMEALRGVGKFAGGMTAFTISALLFTTIDKILLSKLLTLSDFGYYSLAVTVASSLLMLVGPITTAFYPKFCELYAKYDKDGLVESFHKGSQMVSVVAGSAAIVLIYFAEVFLHLWTQDINLASRLAGLLRLLMLGSLIGGLTWIPYQMQLAHGWTSLSVYLNSSAAVITAGLILWLVPSLGMLGAAYILLLVGFAYNFLLSYLMFRRIMINEKWRWITRDVAAPLLSSALSVGLLKVLWPTQETALGQISVLIIATVLALSASILVSRYIRQQIFSMVDKLLFKA